MSAADRLRAWSPDRRALLRALIAEHDAGSAGSGPTARRGAPARREEAAAAPGDGLEARLVRIWEDVLAVRPVGVRDSFFDLGGHSLLAVRLFAAIWKSLGTELPLTTILQAPTVQALARVLRQHGPETSSALVPIQPVGTAPPLFCVHQHSGQIFCYQALARHLGSDQPVYGVKPVAGADGPPARIEDMAARYEEAIRGLQSEGPYHLAGYCFGGAVAYEVARQLHAGGQRVALLALIEAERPGDARGPLARARRAARRVGRELDAMADLPHGDRAGFLLERAAYAAGRAQRLLAARGRPARAGAASGDSPAEGELRAIAAVHESAIARYVPQPYAGRVTLFTPGRGRGGRHPGTSDLGWARLAHGGLTVHEIPCDGPTLVNEPEVRALAEALLGCLAASPGR